MKKTFPALAVVLAGVLWGFMGLFVKNLQSFGFDSMQICFIRMLVSSLSFLLFTALVSPTKLKIRLKDIWLFICTGIISVVMFNVCYFYTIIHSQASVAVVLLYTSPIFIMILSAIFFKEKITLQKVIALVLTFVGCLLVAEIFGGSYSLGIVVILTGLGSGLFYALYTIFGTLALKKYDTVTLTAYTFLFGLLGSLPIGKAGTTFQMLSENPVAIAWCVGIGILCTVLPYFFYTWGLARMESSRAAILVAVEPLVGAIVGMTIFHESTDIMKIIGIALILCAIVVLNIRFPQKRKKSLTK